jgi:malonyl-CoA/methylmalonyl-CoA synthetase
MTVSAARPQELIAPHLFEKLLEHQSSVALLLSGAETEAEPGHVQWTYATLLRRALVLRDELNAKLPQDEEQPRVAMLGARGASYLVIQWAIWLAGAIAVPLHPAHPADEMDYIVSDSAAALLVANESFTVPGAKLQAYVAGLPGRMNLEVLVRPDDVKGGDDKELTSKQRQEVEQWLESRDYSQAGAYMIYTSGTTGRPKGVITTHAALTAQISDLVTAWEMSSSDHLIHFLPLHHVHGILNNMLCVLYVGGSVEFLSFAKPSLIWYKLGQAAATKRPVTMLMAVPTVYMKLLEAIEKQPQDDPKVQRAMTGARGLRVAISGSMACPVSILSRWESLTKLRLLERYGMTELGMVLTNPLHGDRHLGYVGNTFPSVSVRVVDPDTETELPLSEEKEGELRVKGPSVFRAYWRKPEATAKEFDADGWFKTGDIVQYNNERQSFRIRGRASADILKTAGYKVSALDVERVLLTHPQVLECAVFGLPDETWGQIVAAVIRSDVQGDKVGPDTLSPPLVDFSKEHLASYRVPRKYYFVEEIPKNAMGKVNKKALAKIYAEETA